MVEIPGGGIPAASVDETSKKEQKTGVQKTAAPAKVPPHLQAALVRKYAAITGNAKQETGTGEKAGGWNGGTSEPVGRTTAGEAIPGLSPLPRGFIRVANAVPANEPAAKTDATAASNPGAPKAVALNLAILAGQKDKQAEFDEAAKKAHLEDPAGMRAVVDATLQDGFLGVKTGTSHPNTKAATAILNAAAQSSDGQIRANAANTN